MRSRVESWLEEGERVTIIGDGNCAIDPYLDHANGTLRSEVSSLSDLIMDGILTNVWRQQHPFTRDYTFFTVSPSHLSRSRIDIVLQDPVTAKDWAGQCQIMPHESFCVDHNPIRIEIYVTTTPPEEESPMITTKIDQKRFKSGPALNAYKAGTDHLLANTPICSWFNLQELMRKALDLPQSIGYKKMGKREMKDPLTKETRELHTRITKAKQVLIMRPPTPTAAAAEISQLFGLPMGDLTDLEEWYKDLARLVKKQAQKLTTLIRKEKKENTTRNVERVIASEEKDPRTFFSRANPDKAKAMQSITMGDKLVSGRKDVGTALVAYWSKIYSGGEELPSWEGIPWLRDYAPWYRQRFNWSENAKRLTKPFSISEMQEALSGMKDGKAAYDLPVECLKYAGPSTQNTLLEIINRAYTLQEFPGQWSSVLIRLIFKSGDRTDCGNYRPISIADAAYRLLMKMVTIRVSELVESCGILAEEQGGGGFRKGRGCEDKVMLLKELLRRVKEAKGKKVYIFYIDIKKCFDRVSHSLIQQTFAAMGFPPQFCQSCG